MKKINLIKEELNNYGYRVYSKVENRNTYLKGGYSGEDIEKNLSIHIKILIEDNKYVFIDWDKQVAIKKVFDSENEVIDYIEEKYPLD